jgi:hypothetical protein
MSIYVIFPIMLNDIFKSFNPIQSNRRRPITIVLRSPLSRRVEWHPRFLQSSETPDPWCSASICRIIKSNTDSYLANKVGEELGQASESQVHRSLCDHCDTWNCPCEQKKSPRWTLRKICPLSWTIPGRIVLIKYYWVNRASHCNACRLISFAPLKKSSP